MESYPDVLKIATVIPLHKRLTWVIRGPFQYCSRLIKSLKQFCTKKNSLNFGKNLIHELNFNLVLEANTQRIYAITCVYETTVKELVNQKSVCRISFDFANLWLSKSSNITGEVKT